jgi:hypothetical protein
MISTGPDRIATLQRETWPSKGCGKKAIFLSKDLVETGLQCTFAALLFANASYSVRNSCDSGWRGQIERNFQKITL